MTYIICFLLVLWFPEGLFPLSLEVRDFRGKEIRLLKPAQRVVCLIESALTGIYMLNRGDRVVGIPRNVYDPPTFRFYRLLDERIESQKLPAPGNWEAVSIENILALRPDLVIIWSHQTSAIAAIERFGIPVFGVFITKEEEIYEEILALGKLMENEERAKELVDFTKKEREYILSKTTKIPELERPKVFFMWAQGITETSCGGSMVNDLITLAGGKNICGHINQEHGTLQIEDLVRGDPDVIVMWYNERMNPEDLLKDSRLRNIKAIQNRRVYELSDIFTNDLWTLKFIIAVHRLARWLHPSIFSEASLENDEKKILNFFYGYQFK
ncbi:MAG: ABC transporter substrate-binding protein [Syntrophobacterales bacterium]|nr:ABC transporter substrate-binding protein [Syntrophobacterales bacterium]